MIYDRSTGAPAAYPEYGSVLLRFLYTTVAGRIVLKAVASHAFSRLVAIYYHSPFSLGKVARIVNGYGVSITEFTPARFRSFNDFFTRSFRPSARPLRGNARSLIAVADAKLSHHPISADLQLCVKGATYTIAELIDDPVLAKQFAGGTCLAFRLTIDDCHRYIFPDDGSVVWTKSLPGMLHTVQPIAHQHARAYVRNQRVVSLLTTKHWGDIVVVEVGALLVGTIRNHAIWSFRRGQEKGYFELGGSTIIMLLSAGTAQIDTDIVQYSTAGAEVIVRQGEVIGAHV